ncbi:MAG: hypothetical protein QJR06_03375 [Alicyclobacillaceae bacterium]|nr:hypothetical protein [Alicyclobacillaceae bacterium]
MDELRVAVVFQAWTERAALFEAMQSWRRCGLSVAASHGDERVVFTSCSAVGAVRIRAEEGMVSGTAGFYGDAGTLGEHVAVRALLDLLYAVGAAGTVHVSWSDGAHDIRFTRGLLFWDVLARTDWKARTDWELVLERETWTGHVHRNLDRLAEALWSGDLDGRQKAVAQLAQAEQQLQRIRQELIRRRTGVVLSGRGSG